MGYFAENNNQIIFMNTDYVIKVENDKVYTIEGYERTDGFQTVISLGSKYFAAAFSQSGLKIFTI